MHQVKNLKLDKHDPRKYNPIYEIKNNNFLKVPNTEISQNSENN